MIKSFLLISLAIVCMMQGYAQNAKIDSLNQLINKAATDTGRVKLTYRKMQLLSKVNLDSALSLGKKTLEEAKKINYYRGVTEISHEMAVDYFFKGDYKSAQENLDFLKQYIKPGDSDQVARIYANYGMMYGMQSKYDSSIQFLEKAIGIAERLKDTDILHTAYQNVSIGYQQTSNLPQALFYQQKALDLAIKKNDVVNEAYTYMNMGITYEEMSDYARAEATYLQAIDLAKKKQLTNVELYGYSNLATLYVTQKKWQQAYDFAIKAATLGGTMGNQGMQAASMSKAAVALSQMKRFDEASKLDQTAMDIADSSHQPLNIFQAYVSMGSILREEGRYKEAIPFYEKGFSYMKDANDYDIGFGLSMMELSECYEKTGDLSKSLETYKKYSIIMDSVKRQDNVRRTTELTMNYEFDKKQELQRAEQAKKDAVTQARQLALIIGLALTLILAAVAFYAFRNKQKANKIIKAEKKRSDDLLLNILPAETAEELKSTGSAKAKSFNEVTVMFTDFKNFTRASEKMSAEELVKEINFCYSSFDKIISKYGIEKIKTIGDSYMCAGGLPVENLTHPADVIIAAIEIRDFILKRQRERIENGEVPFEIRIGVHTGPIVAGIVGIKKFAYDIWGDTVNIASRMEQNSETGQVNISGNTHALIQHEFSCVYRGKIAVKNKADMDMYFVEARLN